MRTLLTDEKLNILTLELFLTREVDGDMAEIGVYQGGSARAMIKAMPGKIIHLYDTFTGIVNADPLIDIHKNGDFSDTNLFDIMTGENIRVWPGVFPDTFILHDRKFSFVHSDTDTYFGTIKTLEVFYSKMSPGGKILFDDWNWKECPGVNKAINEFMAGKPNKTVEYTNQFVVCF